jgi:hypothetical protein
VPAPLPNAPLGIKMTYATSPSLIVEMFHDVCCPFSSTMFNTVSRAVLGELERRDLIEKVEFLFQCVPQPWHSQSCCMNEAVMAAVILDDKKACTYIHNLFARQTEFFDDTTKDLSRNQLYDQLSAIGADSGYDGPAFRKLLSLDGVQGNDGLGDVTQRLKWAAKYHRVRAVHVTPTVFMNGIEAPDVGSAWGVDEWMVKLGSALGCA